MRYILALLGTFCTLSGIHGAVNITGLVTNFTNSGLAALNVSTIQFINATIAADKQVNASMSAWNTTLISNLTALAKKFVNYTGFIDTTTPTNAAINTISAVTVLPLAQDPQLNSLYCSISDRAQQIAAELVAFASSASANVSACTTDFSSQCLTKYAANLTSAGVNISRFGACLTNQTNAINIIAANKSSYINTNLGIIMSQFNLTNICYIPTVAQLIAAQNASTTPPSMNCITQFFSSLPYMMPNYMYFVMGDTEMKTMAISQRVQRCIDLTTADIRDILGGIAAAYSNCLITGP